MCEQQLFINLITKLGSLLLVHQVQACISVHPCAFVLCCLVSVYDLFMSLSFLPNISLLDIFVKVIKLKSW